MPISPPAGVKKPTSGKKRRRKKLSESRGAKAQQDAGIVSDSQPVPATNEAPETLLVGVGHGIPDEDRDCVADAGQDASSTPETPKQSSARSSSKRRVKKKKRRRKKKSTAPVGEISNAVSADDAAPVASDPEAAVDPDSVRPSGGGAKDESAPGDTISTTPDEARDAVPEDGAGAADAFPADDDSPKPKKKKKKKKKRKKRKKIRADSDDSGEASVENQVDSDTNGTTDAFALEDDGAFQMKSLSSDEAGSDGQPADDEDGVAARASGDTDSDDESTREVKKPEGSSRRRVKKRVIRKRVSKRRRASDSRDDVSRNEHVEDDTAAPVDVLAAFSELDEDEDVDEDGGAGWDGADRNEFNDTEADDADTDTGAKPDRVRKKRGGGESSRHRRGVARALGSHRAGVRSSKRISSRKKAADVDDELDDELDEEAAREARRKNARLFLGLVILLGVMMIVTIGLGIHVWNKRRNRKVTVNTFQTYGDGQTLRMYSEFLDIPLDDLMKWNPNIKGPDTELKKGYAVNFPKDRKIVTSAEFLTRQLQQQCKEYEKRVKTHLDKAGRYASSYRRTQSDDDMAVVMEEVKKAEPIFRDWEYFFGKMVDVPEFSESKKGGGGFFKRESERLRDMRDALKELNTNYIQAWEFRQEFHHATPRSATRTNSGASGGGSTNNDPLYLCNKIASKLTNSKAVRDRIWNMNQELKQLKASNGSASEIRSKERKIQSLIRDLKQYEKDINDMFAKVKTAFGNMAASVPKYTLIRSKINTLTNEIQYNKSRDEKVYSGHYQREIRRMTAPPRAFQPNR